MSDCNRKCSCKNCPMGGDVELLRCSNCRTTYYCSIEHQKQDWCNHKYMCKAINFEFKYPDAEDVRFLIVGHNFIVSGLKTCLKRSGTAHVVVEMNRKNIVDNLRSGKYTSLVVFDFGSGGVDKDFFHDEVRWTVTKWVAAGGKLIIHGKCDGDRCVMGVCRGWFGKTWTMCGDYCRTTHQYTKACPYVEPPFAGSKLLPEFINVKACLASTVPSHERLYSPPAGAVSHSHVPGLGGVDIDPNLTLAALGTFERGFVGFMGDVNGEPLSMTVIEVMGKCINVWHANMTRRKHFLVVFRAIEKRIADGRVNLFEQITSMDRVFITHDLQRYIMSFI